MKRWLVLILGVILISVAVFIFISPKNEIENEFVNDEIELSKQAQEAADRIDEKNAESSITCEKVKFDYAPVNLEKTEVLLPLGLMTGSHVTPIDHHYFQNFFNNEPDIEVYSPGKGYVTSIQLMQINSEVGDYRVVVEHDCRVSSIYIHIFTLSEKLQREITGKNYASTRVPIEAGELIGYYKTNVDYNLVDENFVLTGFVNPDSYKSEPWKIHVPDTYEYFNELVRSKLIEKSLRTVEPISGKIDYDVDDRLVGNWFLEGTNGYAGVTNQEGRYWLGHLSFAYDAYDPERIVLSIGNYEGEDSKQFAVKGNAPNPKNVGLINGLVKYELVIYDWLAPDESSWDRKSMTKPLTTVAHENKIEGTALVQLIENKKIKFEVFPGKTASQVSGFTANAMIYER